MPETKNVSVVFITEDVLFLGDSIESMKNYERTVVEIDGKRGICDGVSIVRETDNHTVKIAFKVDFEKETVYIVMGDYKICSLEDLEYTLKIS